MVKMSPRGGSPSRSGPGDWFRVLESARRASARNLRRARTSAFTARELALEAGIPASVASAYCSKFRTWGYLSVVVKERPAGTRGRPSNLYELTEYGRKRDRPEIGRREGRPCPRCNGTGRVV